MHELSPDFIPSIPGVKIMWLANLVVYSIIFFFAMKHRLIESAL
jgi:uncharacterized protein YqgC (DUF456 family)